jgi:arsenate reductase (glutaredoxin)
MLSIYHNPRCSKSRQTLALIETSGTPVEVILYLETPPPVEELQAILHKLDRPVLEMLRPKETTFKELGLSTKDERSDKEWLTLVHEHPILLERPLVVSERAAVIGRPPENVNALLV